MRLILSADREIGKWIPLRRGSRSDIRRLFSHKSYPHDVFVNHSHATQRLPYYSNAKRGRQTRLWPITPPTPTCKKTCCLRELPVPLTGPGAGNRQAAISHAPKLPLSTRHLRSDASSESDHRFSTDALHGRDKQKLPSFSD